MSSNSVQQHQHHREPSQHHVPAYRRPACALGVLMTGYLDKFDPDAYIHKVKRRFVVLTHESLHWFKRAAGSDLFGEERGSIALGDISTVETYHKGGRRSSTSNGEDGRGGEGSAGEGSAFIVSTTDFTKRVFVAASKEEAHKWVSAINTAIKSRYLYRRETLTGLSFIAGLDDVDAARPRILLLSLVRGSEPGKAEANEAETVLARNVEYEKGLPLPPLLPGDKLLLTLVNGSVATLSGGEVIAHQGKEEPLKAVVKGGAHPGALHCGTTLVKQQQAAEASPASPSSTTTVALRLLLSPEHAVPLVAALALLAAALESLEDRKRAVCLASFRQACRELRFGTMVFVALALSLYVVASLVHRARAAAAGRREEEESAAAAAKAAPVAGIYLEVIDHAAATPAGGVQGEGAAGAGAAEADAAYADIPKRYIDGCMGDMAEAARRWRLTVEWRRAYGTDTILEQPHPYFDLIKQCYPHYYCLTGKDGNPVYYERSGQVDQPRMRAAGCGVDELVWHYIYATEFLYKKLHPQEEAKTITVFDLTGVGIRDLAGDAFTFLQRSSSLIQEHYVERSAVIIIANAPGYFSFLWKLIRPMVNERTQKKIRIVKAGKETLEAMKEFIDIKNIPKMYGGELSYDDSDPDSCRWNSPEEVAIREHVHEVNARLGVASRME